MDEITMDDELDELSSAEDFLHYFGVDYDPAIVHVNRLHILQRYHDYLQQSRDMLPGEEEARRQVYRALLQRAYQDFVESDARTEKVFKVFHMHEPQQTFVPLDDVLK